MADNYLEEVRQQYEDYPYPPCNPEDEKKGLTAGFSSAIDLINFYCFSGKENFNDNFQVLIAGGGTGNSLIHLAEQLRECDAHITYVDISTASMAIAKERAEVRGLTNITWIHDSLLNIPKLDIGPFDFIDCIGVLHHLEDPDAGLAALKSVLSPKGAMGLMLYGQYGRTGVYQMQDLMRRINQNTNDIEEKINNTKLIINELPAVSGFKKYEHLIHDHKKHGDIGIYDLILHSQDRAYTVPEVYEFLGKQDLHLVQFLAVHGLGKLHYNPLTYLKDNTTREIVSALPVEEQQAIAELIMGTFSRHNFFVTQQPVEIPSIDDLDMVPFFSCFFTHEGAYENFYNGAKQTQEKYMKFTEGRSKLSLTLENTPHLKYIFKYLDGNRSVREILAAIQNDSELENSSPATDVLLAEIKTLYETFHRYDWMLLRHKDCPAFRMTKEELQQYISNA